MTDFVQWVTHGIKRGRFEMGRRAWFCLAALALLGVLVAALYLMLVSATTARGRRIEQLQEELTWLQRENQQIEVEIARQSSVSRLRQRAYEMGFLPADRVVFIP